MDKDTKTFFGGYKIFPPQEPEPYPTEDMSSMKAAIDWTKLTVTTTTPAVNNTAVRYDQAKLDWSIIPMEALEEVVRVLEFGAQKYHRDNWRTGDGFRYSRVVNSLLRHTYSWMKGEDLDPESGFSHLAHMGCNVLFLLYYNRYKERFKNDDRYKP
jgi:hypothetical protein